MNKIDNLKHFAKNLDDILTLIRITRPTQDDGVNIMNYYNRYFNANITAQMLSFGYCNCTNGSNVIYMGRQLLQYYRDNYNEITKHVTSKAK